MGSHGGQVESSVDIGSPLVSTPGPGVMLPAVLRSAVGVVVEEEGE